MKITELELTKTSSWKTPTEISFKYGDNYIGVDISSLDVDKMNEVAEAIYKMLLSYHT